MSPKTIPLYALHSIAGKPDEMRLVGMIDARLAEANTGMLDLVYTRAAVKRMRPRKLLRAMLRMAPGFFRHVIDESLPANIGVSFRQQTSTGHVWALHGVRGSGDSQRA